MLRGLVADDADRVAVEAREAADDVLGEVLVDLEELAVVDDQPDDVAHVVRLVRVVGDDACRAPRPSRFGSSVGSTRGGVSRLFCGRKREEVARVLEAAASSSSEAKCATPDFELCVIAPPSSSKSTSSPVTVLMTSGPVMNMCDVSFTMKMKSVIAGE